MYKHSNTKGHTATACAANKEELPMPEALENQHRCGWIPPLLLHNGTQELTGVTAVSQEMRIGHSGRLLSSRSLKHMTVATVCVNKLKCCGSFRKHCEWHVWIQWKEPPGQANKGRQSSVNWAYGRTMGHSNYTAITLSNNAVYSHCMQKAVWTIGGFVNMSPSSCFMDWPLTSHDASVGLLEMFSKKVIQMKIC